MTWIKTTIFTSEEPCYINLDFIISMIIVKEGSEVWTELTLSEKVCLRILEKPEDILKFPTPWIEKNPSELSTV